MAITDKHGNKLPQPRIRKRDKSAAERLRIAGQGKHCLCGYRKRGPNHDNGQHHQTWANNDR